MKPLCLLFVIILVALFTGCAAINHPTCNLKGAAPNAPASLIHERTPWYAGGQPRFPYSQWEPKQGRPKAVVILVPGWDATMKDYEALGTYLAAHGYAVYGSEERTGVYDPVKSRQGNPCCWEDWVSDLQEFTKFVAHKHPGLPVFYHGHSFGTLVAAEAASQNAGVPQLRGVILQSVAMPMLIEKENPVKGALVGAFSWVRVPHLLFAGERIGPTGSKEFNCQWMRSQDRLAEGYKVRYFLKAAKLGHEVWETSQQLKIPVLALEGEQDRVVAPSDAEKWKYDQFLRYHLCNGNATVMRYHNGYHTMTIPRTGDPRLDATTKKALADIAHWLDAHSTGRKAVN